MMDDIQRIETLVKVILDKKEFSLIERLELIKDVDTESSFANFVLTCLVLLEKSDNYYESASSLLLRKIYHEKIFLKGKAKADLEKYGKKFLQVLEDKAIYPYTRTSNVIRRLISSIIYKEATDVPDILSITPHASLIASNVTLLGKYLGSARVDLGDALIMCYNCVADISSDDQRITVASDAISTLKPYLNENFESYLKIFIRPYYVSPSNDFPGIELHVPEPFYSQIFGSHEVFMNHLQEYSENENSNKKLASDIKLFMESYQGNNYKPVKLPSEVSFNLHNNARQVKPGKKLF